MAITLHQLATLLYLVASVAAAVGLASQARRSSRAAVWLLGGGVLVHGLAFWQLHTLRPTPSLGELPLAISLTAWIGSLSYLLLLTRVRGAGLSVLVAPLAFLGAFLASLTLPRMEPAAANASPLWSHLHVLLASAGLALAGVAGAAGVLYVVHHRVIKAKRGGSWGAALPSLEALDRVNAIALTLGFLLLGLGVISGVLWVNTAEGRYWPGGFHANAALLAWLIYAILVLARFAGRQGARRAAIHSALGFMVMLLAVVGVRLAS